MRFERGDGYLRDDEIAVAVLSDKIDTISFVLGNRPGGAVHLGSGKRPTKGRPPQPTNKRAKVKAARKANQRRKS